MGRAWRAALEQPEWLEDERFKTPALRQKNIDARLQLTQDGADRPARPPNGSSG